MKIVYNCINNSKYDDIALGDITVADYRHTLKFIASSQQGTKLELYFRYKPSSNLFQKAVYFLVEFNGIAHADTDIENSGVFSTVSLLGFSDNSLCLHTGNIVCHVNFDAMSVHKPKKLPDWIKAVNG